MALLAKRTRHGTQYPWKDEQKIVFLRILANWKLKLGASQAYKWPAIVSQFNKETQPPADRSILQNKLTTMRTEYSQWKQLLTSETGLVIDPTTGIIMEDGLWWDRKIKEQPTSKRFRFSGIPKEVEDLYCQIFGGSMATGEHLAMPGMGIRPSGPPSSTPPPVTEVEPMEEGGSETGGDTYIPLHDDGDEGDFGATPGAGPSIIQPIRAFPLDSCVSCHGTPFGAQSKKQKTYAQTHEEAAQNIAAMKGHMEEFMAMAKSYKPPAIVTSHLVVEERVPTCEQTMVELLRLKTEGIIDGSREFMGFAIDFLGNKDRRQMFMAVPTDEEKAAYLEHVYSSGNRKK